MFMKKWRFLAAIDTCDIGHEHLKTSKLQLIYVCNRMKFVSKMCRKFRSSYEICQIFRETLIIFRWFKWFLVKAFNMHLVLPDLTQMPHEIFVILIFDDSYHFRRTFAFGFFEADCAKIL